MERPAWKMTVGREENHEVSGAQRDLRAFALIKDIIPFRVLVDFCQSVDVLPDDGFLAVNEVLEIDVTMVRFEFSRFGRRGFVCLDQDEEVFGYFDPAVREGFRPIPGEKADRVGESCAEFRVCRQVFD